MWAVCNREGARPRDHLQFCKRDKDESQIVSLQGSVILNETATVTRDLQLSRNTLYLLSPRLCFFIELNLDLFANRDDSLVT